MFKIKLRYFNQISIFLMKNHLEECSKLLTREINLSTNGINEYSKEKSLNLSINHLIIQLTTSILKIMISTMEIMIIKMNILTK
ncbi:MAG: hypothetical protein AD073_000326 [Mycoplasmataceae bacterium]|nr:MAG: hypothetical protein AD073_000326 [Mycoplasmataceae bacterium]